MQITTIGIDLAKTVFEVHAVDADGATVVRKRLRRDRPWACYMEGTRTGNGSVQVPGVSELQPPGYTEHRHDRSASRTRSRYP
jgi:hypothetical protein